MKKYTRLYLDFFGFQIPEDCVCEIPDCNLPAVDINHINARGMGGNPKGDKDQIENLMAMCRNHHNKFGDSPQHKPMMVEVHLEYMKRNGLKNKYLEYLNKK